MMTVTKLKSLSQFFYVPAARQRQRLVNTKFLFLEEAIPVQTTDLLF